VVLLQPSFAVLAQTSSYATGVAGTKQEFTTNAVLAAGLSGFNPHRRANSSPET